MIITIVAITIRPRIRIKRYRFFQQLRTWDLRKFENMKKLAKLYRIIV